MPITRTYYKVHRVFPDPDYFYMENISGNTATFGVFKSGTPASTDLAYSFDKVTWTDIHNGGSIKNVANGAKVYFRSSTGFNLNGNNYYKLKGTDNLYSKGEAFNVGGHIATLINYLNVEGVTSLPTGSLYEMLGAGNKNGLVHANIDFYGIKTLGGNSCTRMFYLCEDLITIPDFSDIENIGNNGCYNMYQGCTSLTTPSDLSSVTSIGSGGCSNMYYGCTSLTTGSDLSSVTSIGSGGCSNMYQGCTSLTTATAPNVSTWDTNTFYNWLYNVASTGVVRKPAGLTIPTDNVSGIPTGWTTTNY